MLFSITGEFMARLRTWVFIAFGVAALSSLLGWVLLRRDRRVPEFTTEGVARHALRDSVSANGEIQPRTRVNVGVQVTAAIQEIHVVDGQWVKAGQLLVTLDQERYRQSLQQAEMGLRMARKDLDNAGIAARAKEATFKRHTLLHREGLTHAEDFQKFELEWETAAKALERATVAVEQARAQVAIARDDLGKTVIRASMAGQVTSLKAEKGETAIAGTTNLAGAVLMVISDFSELMAELKVGELDVVKLKPGQPAEISVDAVPPKIYPGRVISVATGTDRHENAFLGASQEIQSYKVRVLLEDGTAERSVFRPGMSARIAVLTEEKKGVLTVPLAAIQEREAKGGGLGFLPNNRAIVFVVKDGKALERGITTGLITRNEAEVLAGLQEGDQVISGPTRQLALLADGMPVRLQKAAP